MLASPLLRFTPSLLAIIPYKSEEELALGQSIRSRASPKTPLGVLNVEREFCVFRLNLRTELAEGSRYYGTFI